jgi:hypothetical protein
MEVIQKLLRDSAADSEENPLVVQLQDSARAVGRMLPNSALTQRPSGGRGDVDRLDEILARFQIKTDKDFPITRWHLQNARQQLANSPRRKENSL